MYLYCLKSCSLCFSAVWGPTPQFRILPVGGGSWQVERFSKQADEQSGCDGARNSSRGKVEDIEPGDLI